MAFTKEIPFTIKNGTSLVIWDGLNQSVAASTRQADTALSWFNPGQVGTFKRILIQIRATSSGGNSSIDIFWKGATENGTILPFVHDFWTAITVTTSEKIFMYYADVDQTKGSVGGTAAVSDYMFSVPYLTFGFDNTDANACECQILFMGQLA